MHEEFRKAPSDYWVTPTGVSVLHKAFKLWNKHIRGNPVAHRVLEHEMLGLDRFSKNDSFFVEFQKAGWDHFLKFLDWWQYRDMRGNNGIGGWDYKFVCLTWWKQ
jgi:hypothetical protein